MLDASLVVPTRDRAELLMLSLPHMLRQTLEATRYEVIVVDDGSTDATPAVVEQLACKHLRYIHKPSGGGVARNRNRALEIARGRVAIFLDDDTFIGPNFVSAHIALHRD